MYYVVRGAWMVKCMVHEIKKWMNELFTHVFSLRLIRSNLLVSHCQTSKTSLGRSFKTLSMQASSGLPQSPKLAKKQKESFSPAICFKVVLLKKKEKKTSFALSLPGLAFILHPLLYFPLAFPLFVLSLFTFFSHSCFILPVPLQ